MKSARNRNLQPRFREAYARDGIFGDNPRFHSLQKGGFLSEVYLTIYQIDQLPLDGDLLSHVSPSSGSVVAGFIVLPYSFK